MKIVKILASTDGDQKIKGKGANFYLVVRNSRLSPNVKYLCGCVGESRTIWDLSSLRISPLKGQGWGL